MPDVDPAHDPASRRPAARPTPRRRLAGAVLALALAVVALATAATPAPPASGEPAETTVHPVSATALTAGAYHACALGTDGQVRCWGANNWGQLGLGSTNGALANLGDGEAITSQPPVDLGPGRTATQISAGDQHTCALLDNGAVRCWGYNIFGQLGTGSTDYIGDNEPVSAGATVDLGAGRTAVAISAGGHHSCAILDNGLLRCWGDNSAGELGLGTTAHLGDNESVASVPPVYLGSGRTVSSVSAGGDHTCALLDNDQLRCWGDNGSGQLGLGSTDDLGDNEIVVAQLPVFLGAGRTAVAVSAGEATTCAVLDDGSVRCWGRNSAGVLGLGTTPSLGLGEPLGDDETITSAAPVYLGPDRTATGVYAGAVNTCAQLDNGALRCWGDDAHGQLAIAGDEAIGDDELPLLPAIPLGSGRTVRAAAVGDHHFVCATLDDATVRCWGRNTYGQLGLGSTAAVGDDELPSAAGPVPLGFPARIDPVATGLTAKPRPARDRARPYVFTVSGRVTGAIPEGACTGTVTVKASGKVRLAGTRTRVSVAGRATAPVAETDTGCGYRARLAVKAAKRKHARAALVGSPRATASYGGAPLLRRSQTSVRLRLG